MSKRYKPRNLFLILVILLSIPAFTFAVSKRTNFFQRAYFDITARNADLVIDLSKSGSFIPNWRFLAQGGEGKSESLESVSGEVKNLEPYYIRIDHIYDFYDVVSRDPNGNLLFNWEKLDKEINVIQKMGARPFLSLSYMPEAISRGSEVDLPEFWNEWQLLVKSTIEHVSGNNDLAIAGVYYEVWNEPDHFGKFELSGEKNYLTLYKYSEKGAREAHDVLPFMFGGPSTTALYKDWFDTFFDFASENNLRVDFYSWHRYSIFTSDFEKDYENASKWIKKYPRFLNTQFIVSEAGFNSENDLRYDEKFAAIHTLSLFAASFQKNPMIFSFEIKDGKGPEKYWGRWGIMTNEYYGDPEKKPRYLALEFLNNFDWKYFTVSGQGTWVKAIASKEAANGKVKVLIVNYDPYQTHSEKVSISFTNLPFKRFTYKRSDFMGNSVERNISVTSDLWSTEEFFSPNSAASLELIPE